MEETPAVEPEQRFAWEPLDLVLFLVFGVAIVVLVPLGAFLVFRLVQPDLNIANLSGIQAIVMQALMDFALVGFILFLIRRHNGAILSALRLIRRPNLFVGRLIAGGVFLAVAVILTSLVFPTPSESPLEHLLSTTSSILVFAFFGIVFAPMLEEIIFRGFLFGVLLEFTRPWLAVFVTALLFAALHAYQLSGNLPAMAMIFVVGYVLTVVRYRTDSLIPSIIMHTAYNATVFAISALGALAGLGTDR